MRQTERSTPVSGSVFPPTEKPHEIALFGRADGQSPHEQAGIWLLDRDGAEPRMVCEVCGWAELDWAPDAESLVFVENDLDGRGGLYRLDLAEPLVRATIGWPGHEPVKLAASEGALHEDGPALAYLQGAHWESLDAPRWSPRGDEVALIVSGSELRDQGVVLERPFQAVVVKDPHDEAAPLRPIYHAFRISIQQIAWSPDGSRLALLVQHAECGENGQCLEILDRDRGLVVDRWRLSDLGVPPGLHSGLDWAPSVPPGRTEPLFAIGGASLELGEQRKAFHLHLVEPNNPERPSELVCCGRRPAWSPCGRQLLFEAPPKRRQAFGRPCRIDLATGATRKLDGFWWVQRLAWRWPVEAIRSQIH